MMIIGIDFDSTIVKSAFPDIGEEVPMATEFMRRWVEQGDRIILFTVRSGVFLEEAVAWLEERGVELWGINENPDQANWSTSPKPYCDFYIDDKAVGVPLLWPGDGATPYVNWVEVCEWLRRYPSLPGRDRTQG